MGAWIDLVFERWSELWLRIGEHLMLTGRGLDQIAIFKKMD